MSLIKILLKEFNPNQLTIGERPLSDRFKASLAKIGKGNRKKKDITKEEIFDMLDSNGDYVKDLIKTYVNNEFDYMEYHEMFNTNPWYMGMLEETILKLLETEEIDDVVDFDALNDIYEYEKGEKVDPTKPEGFNILQKYFYDNLPMIIKEFESDLEYLFLYFDDILRENTLEIMYNHGGFHEDQYENLDEIDFKLRRETKEINGEECLAIHRAIVIDMEEEHPLYTDGGLGIYWSWFKDGAEPYGASANGRTRLNTIVRAYIPLSNINWESTVYKNIYNLREEKEIETFEDVNVYIYKIEIESNFEQSEKFNKKAELIAKTYFAKKYDKLTNKYSFVNKIKKYLKEAGLEKEDFSITFDDYYISKT